jgi:hypothetical protein
MLQCAVSRGHASAMRSCSLSVTCWHLVVLVMLQQYIVVTSNVWCFVLLQYRQLRPVVALSEQC